MMLLPTGDMYGWLDQDTSLDVLRRFDAGQIAVARYRGRAGQPAPVQAALHAAAVHLDDFREVEVIHRTGPGTADAYRVVVAASQVEPRLLSCSDSSPKAETLYETLSFAPAAAPATLAPTGTPRRRRGRLACRPRG